MNGNGIKNKILFIFSSLSFAVIVKFNFNSISGSSFAFFPDALSLGTVCLSALYPFFSPCRFDSFGALSLRHWLCVCACEEHKICLLPHVIQAAESGILQKLKGNATHSTHTVLESDATNTATRVYGYLFERACQCCETQISLRGVVCLCLNVLPFCTPVSRYASASVIDLTLNLEFRSFNFVAWLFEGRVQKHRSMWQRRNRLGMY